VRNAEKYLSRFVVALRDECLVGLGEALVPGLVPLCYFPDFFVHYQQVVVLIKDSACEIIVFFFRELSVNHGAKLHKKSRPPEWRTALML